MSDACRTRDLVLCVNAAPNHATGRPVPLHVGETYRVLAVMEFGCPCGRSDALLDVGVDFAWCQTYSPPAQTQSRNKDPPGLGAQREGKGSINTASMTSGAARGMPTREVIPIRHDLWREWHRDAALTPDLAAASFSNRFVPRLLQGFIQPPQGLHRTDRIKRRQPLGYTSDQAVVVPQFAEQALDPQKRPRSAPPSTAFSRNSGASG